MKVEFSESYPSGKECKVVEIVILIKPARMSCILRIVVLSFNKLVDEIESRDRSNKKKQ